MNHIYRVVWNEALGVWQAVAEYARARGKTKSTRLRSLALAIVFAAGGAQAADLPTGGSITAGSGAIHQSGSTLTVNQGSGKLAIDWQSFSIGQGHTVNFNQPSASAVALNRVIGSDASVIQGALRANGQVFLVNPNGVLFSPTAQVDVGGLVASTLNITNEDFLAGNYRFGGDSVNAVVNQGVIRANGGTVALVAAKVENSGSIEAHGGRVLLGAGSKVTLDLGGPVGLEIEEGALEALIANGGAIRADGGTVLLTAKAAQDLASTVINSDGLIEARSLVTGERGEVILLGENGTVEVAGAIDVSALEGQGGKAVVTGERVLIADGAHIDATGANGGGEIYVGGGWQGKDASIAKSTETEIAQTALLDASATSAGNGGTVVVWSDGATRFAGDIRARGGEGGKVEVSGKQTLRFTGGVNTGGGLLLIDPTNITVQAANGDGVNTIGVAQLRQLLLDNGFIELEADNDFTWQAGAELDYDGLGSKVLWLWAGNDITYSGKIFDSDPGDDVLHISMFADATRALMPDGTGSVTFNNSISTNGGHLYVYAGSGIVVNNGARLETAGGNIYLGGHGGYADGWIDPLADLAAFQAAMDAYATKGGIRIDGATLDAGGGFIRLRGDHDAGHGVHLLNNAEVKTSGSGTVTIAGRSTSAGDHGAVYLEKGAQIYAEDGDIELFGGGNRIELWNHDETSPGIEATGTGDIRLRTTDRILLNKGTLQVNDGDLDVEAIARVEAIWDGAYRSTGAGNIYLTSRSEAIWLGGSVAGSFGEISASGTGDIVLTAAAGYERGRGTLQGNGQLTVRSSNPTKVFRFGDSNDTNNFLKNGWLGLISAGGFSNVEFESAGNAVVGGNATINANLVIDAGGSIALNGSLSVGSNDLVLQAGEGISQSSGGVTAANLSLLGAGDFTLTNSSNNVNILAANVDGGLSYTDSNGLTIAGIAATGDVLIDVRGGDLSVYQDVRTTGDGASITLQAADHISIAKDKTVESQGGNITLNADRDANGTGRIEVQSGAAIRSHGGDILMRGGSAALSVLTAPTDDYDAFSSALASTGAKGVTITGATVDAGGGDIEIRSQGSEGVALTDGASVTTSGAGDIAIYGAGTNGTGVRLDNASVTTGAGDIVMYGLGGGSGGHKHGVYAVNDAAIRAVSGNIELRGRGATNGSSTNNEGVKVQEDSLVEIQTGTDRTLSITGVGGTGTQYNIGVNVLKSTVRMGADATGRIEISGTGGGSNSGNWGVLTENNGVIESLGAASIEITGTGGGGTDSDGIRVTGGTANRIGSSTMTGDITLIADTMNLQGSGNLNVQSAGELHIRPLNVATTIGLGNGATGTLNLNTTELERLTDGFSAIHIGRADGTGAVDVRNATFRDELTLYGDRIVLNGVLSNAGNSVTLNAANGVSQGENGAIKADALRLLGSGAFQLGGAGNLVNTLAADVGSLLFKNADTLTIGEVAGVAGISAQDFVSLTTAGDLQIDRSIAISGGEATDIITLQVAGQAAKAVTANLSAHGLVLMGGDFDLYQGGNNLIDVIAGEAGEIHFSNLDDLRVGTLTATAADGSTSSVAGLKNDGELILNVDGDLRLEQGILATGQNVTLIVIGEASQDEDAAIKADGLVLRKSYGSGNFALANADNTVALLSGDAGTVAFRNVGDLQISTNTVEGLTTAGDVSLEVNGDLTINKNLDAAGRTVFLDVTGVTQAVGGAVKAGSLALSGGDYFLNGDNAVDVIASDAGTLFFSNAGDLEVGEVTVTDRLGNSRDIVGIDNSGDVSLGAYGGSAGVHIAKQLKVAGSNVFISADGDVTQDADGAITAAALILNLIGGGADLTQADNKVNALSGSATGDIAYFNNGDLRVEGAPFFENLSSGGDIRLHINGNLNIEEVLDASAGNVFLDVTGVTSQEEGGAIKAAGLALSGGDYHLDGVGNEVGKIASNAGELFFHTYHDLEVGAVTVADRFGNSRDIVGIDNSGNVWLASIGSIHIGKQLKAVGRDVTVNSMTISDVTQSAEGAITAAWLELGLVGSVDLTQADNKVEALAGVNTGDIAFFNNGDLRVEGVYSVGDISLRVNGDLHLEEALSAHRNIHLGVSGTVTQDMNDGYIIAQGLALSGGDFELTSPANAVNVIAGDAGRLAFVNDGSLEIGTVGVLAGVNNSGDVSIATNADLYIGEQLKTTANIFLDVAGMAVQGEEGAIAAAGLALTGGDFVLDRALNLVGTFASRAGAVAFLNTGALTVGVLGTVVGIDNSGDLALATTTGDISLAENVHTASQSIDAIVINAGRSAAAGDAAGGSVSADAGVTVTTGAGGRAVIYTGSLDDSEGVAELVGIGSGNFRYGSDESESNFGKALGTSGIYAVYREQPTLIASTNDKTVTLKVYDGKTEFDGGGIDAVDVSGLVNGDTKAMLGEPVFSTVSAEPGRHPILISGFGELGYRVVSDPANAELEIVGTDTDHEYTGARTSVSDVTTSGVQNQQPHSPHSSDDGAQGTTSGGLRLVDATDQGGDQSDAASENENRDVCVSQGESGAACGAQPSQTIFVVQGGIRLPR